MDNHGQQTIRIGEYKLFGVASHIVITAHDETGKQIWEVNGLSHDRQNNIIPIGKPWDGSDTIKGHLDNFSRMGHLVDNQTTIIAGTPTEIEAYRIRARRAIDRINAQNLDYRIDNQNSNSVAGTGLKSFGISPQELLNSTRHQFEKPVPGFTEDLIGNKDVLPAGSAQSDPELDGQSAHGNRLRNHVSAPFPMPRPHLAADDNRSRDSQPALRGESDIPPPSLSEPKSGEAFENGPIPSAKPSRARSMLQPDNLKNANPFDVRKPDLKQQAFLLDHQPTKAKQLILSAGRNPELFGFKGVVV